MNIRTRGDVLRFTALIWALLSLVIVVLVLAVYPPERWAFEVLFSLAVVTVVGTPVFAFVVDRMRQTTVLREALQQLVDRDRLTQVATRDFFFAAFEACPGPAGMLLMVDVDHFKTINDTHGHLAGDAVLQRVATLLRAQTREADIVCRFGGEEFVIFLHATSPEGGHATAERMRLAIAAAEVPLADGAVRATVSIGCAEKAADTPVNTAIARADAALYRAKAAGRNRVDMSGSATLPPVMTLPRVS